MLRRPSVLVVLAESQQPIRPKAPRSVWVLIGLVLLQVHQAGIAQAQPSVPRIIQLTNTPGDVSILGAAISRDGSTVAFVQHDPAVGSFTQLFSIRTDGTGLAPLAPDLQGISAHVSFDDDALAFAACSSEPCYFAVQNVYVIRSNGTGLTQLTFPGRVIHPESVAISGQGSKVAFVRDIPPFFQQLVVINTDGTDERVLLQSGCSCGSFYSLSLNSDGSKIAFLSDLAGNLRGLPFLMNTDGTGLSEPIPTGSDLGPVGLIELSGDAKKVAYIQDIGGLAVFVSNADGSDRRMLEPPAKGLYPGPFP